MITIDMQAAIIVVLMVVLAIVTFCLAFPRHYATMMIRFAVYALGGRAAILPLTNDLPECAMRVVSLVHDDAACAMVIVKEGRIGCHIYAPEGPVHDILYKRMDESTDGIAADLNAMSDASEKN